MIPIAIICVIIFYIYIISFTL